MPAAAPNRRATSVAGSASTASASASTAASRFEPPSSNHAADADPLAPVVGLAAAVDGLDPLDAPRLVAAASGTQFDPAVVRVYLAALGAPT